MKRVWQMVQIGGAVLGLMACQPSDQRVSSPASSGNSPGTEQAGIVTPDGPARKQATIDWQAARADYASRPEPPGSDQFAIASGGQAPVVPVLLSPRSFAIASVDGIPELRVVPMADGYYAIARGETYDTIINGSDRLISAPEGLESLESGSLRFSETMTGADVAFRRYGASYLVEFHCKGRPPLGGDPCIDEIEALQIVENLLLTGTQ